MYWGFALAFSGSVSGIVWSVWTLLEHVLVVALSSKSSSAAQVWTSANLALRLNTIEWFSKFITFSGIHLSRHNGHTVGPTMTFLGAAFDDVGSINTVLPTDRGTCSFNLPHTRCSCCGASVTLCFKTTVPTLSRTVSPCHLPTFLVRAPQDPLQQVS